MRKNILKNEKGSALPLIIIVAVLVTAAIGVMVSRTRQQAKLKREIEGQADFDVVFNKINSVLTSPSGCNATFYNGAHAGLTSYTLAPANDLVPALPPTPDDPLQEDRYPIAASKYIDLTTIKQCSDGNNCRPGNAANNTSNAFEVYTDDWDPTKVPLKSGTGIFNIRIYKIRVFKKQTQTGALAVPTILTVKIGLEMRKVNTNLGPNSNAERVVRKDKLIDVYVTLDSTLTRVLGCTSGAQSIQIYGLGYDWKPDPYPVACTGGSGNWVYSPWEPCISATAQWNYSAWSACSVSTCGYGTQTRSALSCTWVANSGIQHRTSYCNFTADSGTKTRTIPCHNFVTATNVADSYCLQPKPAVTTTCTPVDPAVCGTNTLSQACVPATAPSCGAPYTSASCGPGTNCGVNCVCNGNQPPKWKPSSVQGASCVSESTCGWCGIPGPTGPFWTSCTTINPY